VLGIDGIYLANQYDESEDGRGRDIMTKMSFNKGSVWERIPAPYRQAANCRSTDVRPVHVIASVRH